MGKYTGHQLSGLLIGHEGGIPAASRGSLPHTPKKGKHQSSRWENKKNSNIRWFPRDFSLAF